MRVVFFVLALVLGSSARAVEPECARVLTTAATPTDNFVAYLAELHELGTVTNSDLVALVSSDAAASLPNPIPVERSATDTATAIHREAFAHMIVAKDLDARVIRDWARDALIHNGIVQRKRKRMRVAARDSFQKIEFFPVSPGKFMMGEQSHLLEVTLTHAIEVMSTQVTQKTWVDIMKKNPSYFNDSAHQDHPVENVTWWSAVEFINRLSIKSGFEPAYDLTAIKFKQGTNTESGTLDATGGKIKINAPDGDIYLAKGYRLPTEAEAEYMLRSAGKATGNFYFGDFRYEEVARHLKDHAWYVANSEGQTHPVAELKPMVVDGHAFYDLNGNVWEWSHDCREPFKAGKNPIGPNAGNREFRGGGWNTDAWTHRSGRSNGGPPGSRSNDLGFRLVRTLK